MSMTFTKNLANYLTLNYPTPGNGDLASALEGAPGISVSIWANPASFTAGAGDNVIFSLSQDGGSGLLLRADSTGHPVLTASSSSADTPQTLTGTLSMIASNWYNILATVDFAAKTMSLYLGGFAAGAASGLAFGLDAFTAGVPGAYDSIGCLIPSGSAPAATGPQFNGDLHGVGVWKIAIPDAESAFIASGSMQAIQLHKESLVFCSWLQSQGDFLWSVVSPDKGGTLGLNYHGDLPDAIGPLLMNSFGF